MEHYLSDAEMKFQKFNKIIFNNINENRILIPSAENILNILTYSKYNIL